MTFFTKRNNEAIRTRRNEGHVLRTMLDVPGGPTGKEAGRNTEKQVGKSVQRDMESVGLKEEDTGLLDRTTWKREIKNYSDNPR